MIARTGKDQRVREKKGKKPRNLKNGRDLLGDDHIIIMLSSG
jgi:hypothetical protein